MQIFGTSYRVLGQKGRSTASLYLLPNVTVLFYHPQIECLDDLFHPLNQVQDFSLPKTWFIDRYGPHPMEQRGVGQPSMGFLTVKLRAGPQRSKVVRYGD
jgi:hypothetical protein